MGVVDDFALVNPPCDCRLHNEMPENIFCWWNFTSMRRKAEMMMQHFAMATKIDLLFSLGCLVFLPSFTSSLTFGKVGTVRLHSPGPRPLHLTELKLNELDFDFTSSIMLGAKQGEVSVGPPLLSILAWPLPRK